MTTPVLLDQYDVDAPVTGNGSHYRCLIIPDESRCIVADLHQTAGGCWMAAFSDCEKMPDAAFQRVPDIVQCPAII